MEQPLCLSADAVFRQLMRRTTSRLSDAAVPLLDERFRCTLSLSLSLPDQAQHRPPFDRNACLFSFLIRGREGEPYERSFLTRVWGRTRPSGYQRAMLPPPPNRVA